MHRLSLAHLTLDDADPLTFVDAAAKAGFDAVGLRIVAAPGATQRAPVVGDRELIASLKTSLGANALDVLQVNNFWIMPETTTNHIRPVIETAARLGARYVLVVVGDPDLQRAGACFAECCALAEPLGIGVALEFQSYSPVRTIHQAVRMVEDSGYGNAGIVVDALHLDRSGGHPSDLAAIPAGRLSFVQLCDAPARQPALDALRREARGDRLYPGEGALPLVALMEALPGDVPLDLEAPSRRTHLPLLEQARLAAEATRRFLAAYERQALPRGAGA
jgi:sugar phosphate isomerase/epimerase